MLFSKLFRGSNKKPTSHKKKRNHLNDDSGSPSHCFLVTHNGGNKKRRSEGEDRIETIEAFDESYS